VRYTVRFRIVGTYKRGSSVGPWAVDAPTADAAWLQAEEVGIVVTSVITISGSTEQQLAALTTRPAGLPPPTHAPSLTTPSLATLLAVIDLYICFQLAAWHQARPGVTEEGGAGYVFFAFQIALVLLVALIQFAVIAWGRYLELQVDYKINQHRARWSMAEPRAATDRPRDPGSPDVTPPRA
jgi:hypothetical protein